VNLRAKVLLLGIEKVQREDAALLDEVVGVLVFLDGHDHLLRVKGDLGDPARREAVGLAAPSPPHPLCRNRRGWS
jgi:hypothetical protein